MSKKDNKVVNIKYNSAKYEVNKRRKIERHIKKYPNDEVAKLAIKDISYKRKTPKSPYWKKHMIETAKLMKKFTGKFDKGMFNTSDKDVEFVALKTRNEELFKKIEKSFDNHRFNRLSLRAHDKFGNLLWPQ